jgi:predicted O-methyltransferase YrrM
VLSHFDQVTEKFGDLNFMNDKRAGLMRELILAEGARNILEVGFWKGKSSAYFAAILEDRGGDGHLTTIDRTIVRDKTPNIASVLEALGLSHRVTPIFAERSHTWVMARMLEQKPRPQFDFCYFDGGHTWDMTALGLTLVDMLLKPGGFLVVDDLDWTINGSLARGHDSASIYAGYSDDEKAANPVQMAYDLILPRLGYTDFKTERRFAWGLARKAQSGAVAQEQPRTSLLGRVFGR